MWWRRWSERSISFKEIVPETLEVSGRGFAPARSARSPKVFSGQWRRRARGLADQDRTEIVDIGAGGAGGEEIAHCIEGAPCVVAGKAGGRVEARVAEALGGRAIGEGACIVLGAVDPVRIGRQRGDAGLAIEAESEGPQEFGVASAASTIACECYGCLAALQQQNRPCEGSVAERDLAGDSRMDAANLSCFSFDGVREDAGWQAGGPGLVGGGFERKAC